MDARGRYSRSYRFFPVQSPSGRWQPSIDVRYPPGFFQRGPERLQNCQPSPGGGGGGAKRPQRREGPLAPPSVGLAGQRPAKRRRPPGDGWQFPACLALLQGLLEPIQKSLAAQNHLPVGGLKIPRIPWVCNIPPGAGKIQELVNLSRRIVS